jgi:hypothetical protein
LPVLADAAVLGAVAGGCLALCVLSGMGNASRLDRGALKSGVIAGAAWGVATRAVVEALLHPAYFAEVAASAEVPSQ